MTHKKKVIIIIPKHLAHVVLEFPQPNVQLVNSSIVHWKDVLYRGGGRSLELGGRVPITYARYACAICHRAIKEVGLLCAYYSTVSKRIECKCVQQQQHMYTSCSCFIGGVRPPLLDYWGGDHPLCPPSAAAPALGPLFTTKAGTISTGMSL